MTDEAARGARQKDEDEMAKVAIPTVGRQVHYALPVANGVAVRPATVVAVNPVAPGAMPTLQLHVLVDGERDGLNEQPIPNTFWRFDLAVRRGGVPYNAHGEAGTWRWPPFEKPVEVDVEDA